MGSDSFTLQQSFWIRNLIMRLLIEDCHCDLYPSGHSCVRCHRIREAAELFPIQHRMAVQDHINYQEL